MKVFQIGHVYKPNSGLGVIEYLYQLANQLIKEGVEVSFVQFDSESKDYIEEEVDGVRIVHFPKYKMLGMSLPFSFKKWVDNLQATEQNFIFHLHSVFYLPNYSLAKYFQKRKIPYIHTPHDSYSEESMVSNRLLKKIYLSAFDKYVMNGARAIHAITTMGALTISTHTSNKKIKLVTNFVKPYPIQLQVPVKKQVCFIGRMDIYQKGIDLMLEAFSESTKSHPEATFILMGLYLPDELAEFANLLNRYKLNSRQVKVMGKVSDAEKYRILNESYVYFQLSRYEGFGLSVVEALSMRKPIIISDKIPIADTVTSYKAGYVVSSVSEAILSLDKVFSLSHTSYAQFAANAMDCYQDNFRPELATKKLIEMYQESL